MKASLNDNDENEDTYFSDALLRVAKALGEPPAVLFDGACSGSEITDTCEMLRIWESLERAADRRKVLVFLRAIAAQG